MIVGYAPHQRAYELTLDEVYKFVRCSYRQETNPTTGELGDALKYAESVSSLGGTCQVAVQRKRTRLGRLNPFLINYVELFYHYSKGKYDNTDKLKQLCQEVIKEINRKFVK